MNSILLVGGWLATVWIHSLILCLAALVVARCVGFRRGEIRDVSWKAALVGGLCTASVQFAWPGIGWGSVILSQASAVSLPVVSSDGETPSVLPLGSSERISVTPLARGQVATDDAMRSPVMPTLQSATRIACIAAAACFGVGLLIGILRFVLATQYLWRLVERSQSCKQPDLLAVFDQIRSRPGMRRAVALLVSDDVAGPLATGIFHPQVIVPAAALDGRLDAAQLEGMLAHELAHHARRDPFWAAVGHLIAHAFWFQPLVHIIRRNMRSDAEYLADALACRALGGGLGLARCLATMAEWLVPRSDARLEMGGVHLFARRASLKHRVELLLVAGREDPPPTLVRRWLLRTAIVGGLALLIAAAPVVKSASPVPFQSGETEVNRTLATLTMAAALTASAIADEPKAAGQEARGATESRVPVSVHGFSGEVVGTIVSKDTDGASLVLKVQKVTNVWKNSSAEKPRDLVGRTVPIEKFFGRFLDVLLVVKPGDTVMVEVKHVRGDQLQFLGELFKKVEPLSSQDNPKVDGPDRPAKPVTDKPADAPKATTSTEQDSGRFPAGLQGFRGILLGKVVKADAEKGVLVFQAESVKRTWPQNKATNPASSKGKEITVNGIAGKWLDVLLVLKPGDRIEVEAFHNRGEALDFVQEWLKKVD